MLETIEQTPLADGRVLRIVRSQKGYNCLTLCDILQDAEWFVRNGTLEECREAYDEIVSADIFV